MNLERPVVPERNVLQNQRDAAHPRDTGPRLGHREQQREQLGHNQSLCQCPRIHRDRHQGERTPPHRTLHRTQTELCVEREGRERRDKEQLYSEDTGTTT